MATWLVSCVPFLSNDWTWFSCVRSTPRHTGMRQINEIFFFCALVSSRHPWHCYWKKVIIPRHFKHSRPAQTLLKSPPRKSCLLAHRCLWLNCISEKEKESSFPLFMLSLALAHTHTNPRVSLLVSLLAYSTGCCQKSLGRRINCFGFNRQRSWLRQAESVHSMRRPPHRLEVSL